MCPNCTRGLTEKKEICVPCEGTGIGRIIKINVPASSERVKEVEVKPVVVGSSAKVSKKK